MEQYLKQLVNKGVNMLFIPEERVKELLKELREEGKERRRKQALERRKACLKAKEEGKLDEHWENMRKKREEEYYNRRLEQISSSSNSLWLYI